MNKSMIKNLGLFILIFLSFGSTVFGKTTSSSTITLLEYFVDVDPGVGQGTIVEVNDALEIEENLEISVSGLTPGFHTLFIRVQDNDGNWTQYSQSVFYVTGSVEEGTNELNYAEYFIDEDPGVGNATQMTFSSTEELDQLFDIPTNGLTTGFHTLFIRIRDGFNNWTQYSQSVFYVASTPGDGEGEITHIEYFIDEDPGIGKGTYWSLEETKSEFDSTFDIAVTDLSGGFHTLFLRVKDDFNNWTQYSQSVFYVAPAENGAEGVITNVEYFIDEDPGIGKGISLSLEESKSELDSTFDISVANLSEGFHTFFLRVKDNFNNWTQYSQSVFYKTNVINQNTNITALEYFVDEDPGIGKAIQVAVGEQASIDQLIEISVADLDQGFHTLYLRVQNVQKSWTQYSQSVFYVAPSNSQNEIVEIVAFEYFFNEDIVNKKLIDLTDKANEVEESLDFDITSLSIGENKLYLRVQNSTGQWTSFVSATFEKTELLPHTLSFETIEDKVYGDLAFTPTVSSDQEEVVLLTSSDETIATVGEDNQITILGAGEVIITATAEGSDTYVPATITEQVFNIVKADLTVSVPDQGIEYGEEVASMSLSYEGFVNDDDENDLDEIPSISTEATSTSGVGNYDVVLSEVEDNNYNVITEDGAVEITPATLTAAASSESIVYGEATPTFTIAYTGFKNEETSADLTTLPSVVSSLGNTVGSYAVTLGDGKADNYTFNYVDGNLEVTPATLMVDVADASKVYGGELPETTYTYSGFVNDEDESVVTTAPVVTSEATSLSPVGTYEITGGGAEAANYTFEYGMASMEVTPASLVLSAENTSKVYGAALPSFTITGEGFVGDDDMSSLLEAASITTTATSSSDVGDYALTVSGGSADNYTISYGEGTLSVTAAEASVTVSNSEKVYGSELPTFTYTVDGLVNNDETLGEDFEVTYSTEANRLSNVGTYEVSASGSEVSNYTVSYNNGEVVVTPATLMVNLANASKVYGAGLPTTTYTYSGFVNDEDESVVTTAPVVSSEATALSPVGTYEITGSGAEATNYTFEYETASMEVTPASLVLSTENTSKVYGAALPSFTITGEGFVGSDDISVLTEAASVTTTATSESNVGDYALTVSGGLADNYSISYGDESTLSITPASLVLSTENTSKVYGAEMPSFTITGEGFVGSDDISVLTETASVTTEATSESNVGDYALTVSGGLADNYSISYGDESILSITPASATLTVDNSEKVYGEALPEFTYQVEGLVNNDASLGGAVEFSTDATEGSDAGTYPVSATTNAIENYMVTVVNGELEILKAEQEIENFISDQTINLTEESLTLSATATSGLEVSYTSSDESVVSIDGVIANLLVNGEVTITALQEGNQNYNAASSLKALLTVEGSPTSILDEYVSVKVYPNPAINYFVLDEAIESIQIFDTQGRTVKTFTNTSSKYDISTLSSGNYALLIATKSGAKQYSKLIVK